MRNNFAKNSLNQITCCPTCIVDVDGSFKLSSNLHFETLNLTWSLSQFFKIVELAAANMEFLELPLFLLFHCWLQKLLLHGFMYHQSFSYVSSNLSIHTTPSETNIVSFAFIYCTGSELSRSLKTSLDMILLSLGIYITVNRGSCERERLY